LKWDGVRCLFEDAQSEILLLLDSCAVRDAPMAGSNGAKQAIAAYTPDQVSFELGPRSFTASLADTLQKLSTSGRPFSVQRLYDELRQQRQQESAQALARLANGSAKPSLPPERTPAFFTLTPAKGQGIILVPLDPKLSHLQPSPHPTDADGQSARRHDQLLSPEEVLDLSLDEQRVLVCTTFVGDASPDMMFFNQWLHNMPPSASKITVEGMFLGPPTMLLISMPHQIWNIVQHDKVCCFLGYISSHNMIHLYQRLVNSALGGSGIKLAEPSSSLQKEIPGQPANQLSQTAAAAGSTALARGNPNQPLGAVTKDDVEDSAEMQEAAEQLKALSHVRHLGAEVPATLDHQASRLGDSIAVKHVGDAGSPPQGEGLDGGLYAAQIGTPSVKTKVRRPLQKQIPKQETRCAHCSHAPFKDQSSLKKHVAAAHTRPFPCAFSFAGCQSTFGSKNEWKRHIASQHLCLTFYRCSACKQSTGDGKGNEFNRKDLFTQHLRRMHAPFAIKKSINKADPKLLADWEKHVKQMQTSCLVIRRQPPQRSSCPKPGCQKIFEGPGSWDEWMEHVGRHMEKNEAQLLGVDRLLAEWALEEGIIEQVGDGEYRLCGSGGSTANDKEPMSNGNGDSKPADEVEKKEDEEDDAPSITVAIPQVPVLASESMEVD